MYSSHHQLYSGDVYSSRLRRSTTANDKGHDCDYPDCNKNYFDRSNLRRHYREKHNGKSYKQLQKENQADLDERFGGLPSEKQSALTSVVEKIVSETGDDPASDNQVASSSCVATCSKPNKDGLQQDQRESHYQDDSQRESTETAAMEIKTATDAADNSSFVSIGSESNAQIQPKDNNVIARQQSQKNEELPKLDLADLQDANFGVDIQPAFSDEDEDSVKL